MNCIEFHQLGLICMQPGSDSLIPMKHGCSEYVDTIHCMINIYIYTCIYEQRGETTSSQLQGKSEQVKEKKKSQELVTPDAALG